jgi:hypothetical protein
VFLSKSNTTDLDTSSTVKAAKRAQKAGQAAAANAAKSAQNAATAAQNAASLAQTAAQNAAVLAADKAQVAASKAHVAVDKASNAASNASGVAQHASSAAQATAQNATNLAQQASAAAQSASDTAQSVATNVSQNVKDKIFTARTWAAPRLESAADYTANTVAPKVSTALRSTAQQVAPEPQKSGRTWLKWTMLGAGIAAGLGAAAALMRYRFRAAIAADEIADEEVMADSTGSQAAPVNPDAAAGTSADGTEPGTDSSANGRVKASGW